MPRYYFHLHSRDAAVPDPTGAALRDPDEAWEAARAMARNLMASPAEGVNWLACWFEVKDEAGAVVLEFPFSEAVDVGERPH